MGDMTEAEAAIMLAEALQTDLIYRLELLHEAGAPMLILAATLLDLALQLIRAEQGAGPSRWCGALRTTSSRPDDQEALSRLDAGSPLPAESHARWASEASRPAPAAAVKSPRWHALSHGGGSRCLEVLRVAKAAV
jgi:hypothetical protein